MNILIKKYVFGFYVISLFFCYNINSFAQVSGTEISFQSGLQGGFGKYTPFWLLTNNYGKYSVNKDQIFARFLIKKESIKIKDVYYGIDVIENYNKNNSLFINQLYGGLKFFSFHLKAGLKEEFYGNHDSLLSVGGTPWSKNSRPIPQVFIGIPNFTYIPFTRKFLEIRGGISHGWLGKNEQFVKNAYLHFKYLDLRIGTERIKCTLGLYHVAQWGGISPIDSIGKLPSSFKNFLSVFKVEGDNSSKLPSNELINKLGNHIASYQFCFELFNTSFNYRLYYQSFLDDKNGRIGIDWKNKPDMILGFSIKNNTKSFLRTILFEYIYTKNQSGDPNKSGGDNYYNNGIYKNGWTHYNMTIGTPLISSPSYIHNTYTTNYVSNNKVIAVNSGISGQFRNNNVSVIATYSHNYGTFRYPFKNPRRQFSAYFQLIHSSKNSNGLSFGVELGIDEGALLGDNLGIRTFIKKVF